MKSIVLLPPGLVLLLTMAVPAQAAAPPNDNFANRIVLSGAIVTTTGSNVNATAEAGEPTHWSGASGKSVWWTWTAPNSAPATITTAGSSFDTVLAVYTGATVTSLTLVTNNDDATGGTQQSGVTFNATAGTAYQIAVDGWGGASGNITLNLNNSPTVPVTLVATGSVWKYLDDGSNQGTAWRSAGFSDSAWASGRAQLGYGDGDEVTVVRSNRTDGSRILTTYFRQAFTVTNASAIVDLKVRLLRDDGAAVYLNGNEIVRDGLAAGANYTNLATITVAGADETTYFSFTNINPSYLVTGVNVLAAEVHQVNLTSTDISFDLELTGTLRVSNVPPTVAITSPANNAIFAAPAGVTINANAGDPDGSITKVEFFQSGAKLGETAQAPYSFTWNNVYAGSYSLRAVATDSYGATATSAVVSITVTGNVPPNVTLTSPGNNAAFTAPANIAMTADATDPDGSVSKVEFYRGSTLIGQDTASPFSLTWSNAAAGSYALRAVAQDNSGARATSAVVNVSVIANTPPTVSIANPAAGATFSAPANITIDATATDAEGPVSKVEFFANGAKLGEDTSSPFSFAWSGVSTGSYALRAVATDAGGLLATSSVVNVTVTFAGTNTLVAYGSVWKYLDDGSNPGTAWRSSGFDDSAWVAGPAELGYGDGDEQTVVGYGPNASSKYITTYFRQAFVVNNPAAYGYLNLWLLRDDGGVVYLNGTEIYRSPSLPAGTITYQTLADAQGGAPPDDTVDTVTNVANLLVNGTNVVAVEVHQQAANSSDLSFDFQLEAVLNNTPPAVAITSPANNITLVAPVNIPITATASDSDGAIAKVEFFSNANKLGERTATPYSLTWSNVNVGGSYQLRAVATDNRGAKGTSAVVNVTIIGNYLPTVSITNPPNNSAYVAPTNILVGASASDPDGTVSRVDFYANGSLLRTVSANPFTFRWTNAALGSFSLIAVATDNSGASVTSAPVNVTFLDAPAPATLVAVGSVWKYYDTVTAEMPGWNTLAFDDNGWLSGPAELGYGDGNEATVVGYGPNASSKYITTYFRQSFDLADVSTYKSLLVRLRRDDGGVVYLNGAEIFRSNMPGGAVTIGTRASNATDDGTTFFASGGISANVLRSGRNVVAVEIHQDQPASTDISFDMEMIGISTNAPPAIAITSPADNAVYTAPAAITIGVNATDGDGMVTNLSFFANGARIGQSTAQPFTFDWLNVPIGSYQLTAIATDNWGAAATSSVVNVFVVTATAPTVNSFAPPGGTISNLTQITVNFSEPVDGVEAADLLINGIPAAGLTGSNASYTFSFPQPLDGAVIVTWAAHHGIVDREIPPKPFSGLAAGETVQYTLTDTVPPSLALISPTPGATVPSLTRVEVTFSEPVAGVDDANLLVNGAPATKVTGSMAGPYVFEFPQPVAGAVQITWATNQAIHDFAAAQNRFTGSSWGYTLDTSGAETNVVISEIMYHPPPEMPEDVHLEWLELHNQNAGPVNLTGWRFTKGIDYTFGNVTLPAGGYLVVAANVAVFQGRYPGVTNVVGGWAGTLSNNGEDLHLRNAAGDLIDSVSYASQGDWAARLRGRGERQATRLTRSGSTVTAFVFGHDMSSGDQVRIYGADQPEYNGTFSIANVTVSTFTFTIAGTPASPATGIVICRQLTDHGYAGWSWSSKADGLGRSLELINDNLPNSHGQNWAESTVLHGTPGRANSVASANIPPMILDVQHLPLVPHSTDTVTITAKLFDEHTNGLSATLYYRNASTASPGGFTPTQMFDDGLHGDGLAGDRTFGAFISPQTNLAIIEFYVAAADLEGNARTWPAAALDPSDSPIQQANALYQVDNSTYTGTQPIYRFVMTEAERAELKQAHDTANASDVTENTTFISLDGTGTLGHYNVGLRNRGAGTRSAWPMNYRVSFPNDKRWKGVRGIHLNTQYVHSQAAASALGFHAGIDVEAGRPVQVRVNSVNLANAGSPQYGSYMQLEDTDSDYAANHYPFDSNGNAYRGSKAPWDANLDYWGTDPSSYEGLLGKGYFKNSNVSENDWSDLINLCYVLNNTPDANYVEEVRKVVNVEEWMRSLAVYELFGSGETALQTGVGDDYSMYRGIKDPRFILLGHDLDSILGQPGSAATTANLFRMCPSVNSGANVHAFDRFMKHPEFVPIYYAQLTELMDTSFQPGEVSRTLDEVLGDWVPANTINNMKTWAADRYTWVRSQIPLSLTVNHSLPIVNGYPNSTSPTISLNGAANAITTRSVKVNGAAASWTAWLVRWTNNSVVLQPGINQVLVQAVDADGNETDRRTLEVWYDDGSLQNVSGAIAANTTWTAAGGPYNITANLTINAGATLTIQPGATVSLASGVNLIVANGGRLLAEGTATAPIRLGRAPGSMATWGGITVTGAVGSPETRLAYVFIEGNGATAIRSVSGTLFMDHVTFGSTGYQYLSLANSSFLIQDCVFPSGTSYFDLVQGSGGIKSGGRGIFVRNFFGMPMSVSTNSNDAVDFTGGNRPGPSVQFLDNVFIGASDDHLDLDGTDAWVQGNLFLHAHKNGSPDTSSAISGGRDSTNTSEVTIIGNIFYDCDHAAMAKEGNFFTLLNNTIVHQTHVGGTDTTGAVVCLADAGTPQGAGMYLEGNIIYDAEQLTQNVSTAVVTFTNNLLSLPWSGPGGNNVTADPVFVYVPQLAETTGFTNWASAQVLRQWFSLRTGSPAAGTGPNGTDKGGVIPLGVSISGEPNGATTQTTATLRVGLNRTGSGIPSAGWPNGSGYTHYQWRLDNGAWSAETPITAPISLSGLANGLHRVEVVGKLDSGMYQDDPAFGVDALITASRSWTVYTNAVAPVSQPVVRLNEVLASNQRGVLVGDKYPDMIELYNAGATPVNLYGMSLTDDPDNPNKFVFPPGTYLGAGQYLVLYADNDSTPPGLHTGFNLKQSGDDLYLFAANGLLEDSVAFGPQIADLSIGRLADGQWTLTQPTFGTANAVAEVGDSHDLKINEWLTHGVSPIAYDFIELFNPNPLPVCLGGLFLTDNPIGAPRLHEIAPLSFMAGGGYAVFFADGDPGEGPMHLNFRLSADRGVIALLDREAVIIDYILYGPQKTDVSQGRSPNGADTLAFFATPTPGAPNQAPPQPGGLQVVINEVMSKNISGLTNFDGSTPEWIELYNPTTNAISLADMSLTDDMRPPLPNPRKYVFPASATIPARGYYVLFCDGNQPASTNNTGFGIGANGGALYLFDKLANGGSQLDVVNYGVQAADFSIGRLPSGGTNWALTLPTPRGANLAAALGDRMQLRINEWMANPAAGADWFELYNPNPQPVELSFLYLTDNLTTTNGRTKFQIPALSFIGTGLYGYERFWADDAAVAEPDHCNFGLKAGGESLGLYVSSEVAIDAFNFGPQALGVSEGRLPDGSTNIVRFPSTPTPADANYLPLTSVVINEVLPHAADASPFEQAIEVLNVSGAPVNIGGWYLSNQKRHLKKFRIPNGTWLPVGGFKVFYQNQFYADPRDPACFLLDAAHGDNVWLSTADTNANLTGYRAEADFGAGEAGVSFGRYVNSVGAVDYVALTQHTFGQDNPETVTEFRLGTGGPNAQPRVGPVVISEIMYHPPDNPDGSDNVLAEFIELHNMSAGPVPLYDPAYPTNTWRLRDAVKFDFPTNVVLPAGGELVVVSFDPVNDPASLAAFLDYYRISRDTRIYGPYSGKLDNGGESVELCKPDAPLVPPALDAGYVPSILVERVNYSDAAPWPITADGYGYSLQRVSLEEYGNDPANWTGSTPTPGPMGMLDSDSDGIPDAWMQQYFGHPTGQAADHSLAADDADGDGLTNLQEYLAGTDPRDAQSGLRISILGAGPAGVLLQFNAAADKSYTIEYRDTLASGVWTPLTDVAPGAARVVNVTDQFGAVSRFYRLRVP